VSRHVDPELKRLLVARLREQRAGGGPTSASVRDAAAAMGVSERSVWAWLASETLSRKRRARYEVTEADRDAFGHGGATWPRCTGSGWPRGR
jgi:putative transposase